MNRKLPVSIALAITLIAMTVTFSITMIVSMSIFDNTVSSVVKKQAMYDKLSEIDTYVRGNYFGEVDEVLLGDRLGRGYVEGVGDKYSTYYSEKEFTEMQLLEEGKLVGIGIEVTRNPDGLFGISRVYEDSPADKAGVKAGGSIQKIDGQDTIAISSEKALQSALRGEPGTTLELSCLYAVTEEKEFSIQRVDYRPPTVERIMENGYAYIRVSSFGSTTATEFDHLVQQLEAEQTKGLVIDLRDNSGGSFEAAYQMIDQLCPRGTIARSENKSGVTRLLATSDESHLNRPTVVLVNENTAAAAELFAVSIRDLAQGKLVGVKTQGRGMLQSAPYRLSDGSAVSITIATLLTSKDESFDGIGILPDIEVISNMGEGSNYLLNPDLQKDAQILRGFDAVRTMAKEAGLDDGTEPAITPQVGSGSGSDPFDSSGLENDSYSESDSESSSSQQDSDSSMSRSDT